MGHSEVAETPCQRGDDGQETVGSRALVRPVVALEKVQVARKLLRVGDDVVHAACLLDPEEDDDDQSDGHKDTLDQVRGGDRHEAAQRRVGDDDNGTRDHGRVVLNAEEAVEQGSHCLEAGSSVRDKEDDDDKRRDQRNGMFRISVALGEILRDGDGVDLRGIPTQKLCHQQEVQIGAAGEADDGPAALCDARDVGKARKAHQQIGTHVRRFRAHGGDDRSQGTAADVEFIGAVSRSLSAEIETDEQHGAQVCHDGGDDNTLC